MKIKQGMSKERQIKKGPFQLDKNTIEQHRDFDELMGKYKAEEAPRRNIYRFLKPVARIAALLIVVVGVIYLLQQKEDDHPIATGGPSTPDIATVRPPMAELGIDLSKTKYVVSAQDGAEIIHEESGSRLIIPAGAFLDDKGNEVDEDVTIEYREFHDPIDLFLGGVPMTYELNGETYHFETAGMIEFNAFYENEVLYANPNQPITVELASDQVGEEFGLYHFDDKLGTWVPKGQPSYEEPVSMHHPEQTIMYTGDVLTSWEVHDIDKDGNVVAILQYVDVPFNVDQEREVLEYMNPLPTIPYKPVQATSEIFQITFDVAEFPELKGYDHLVFEREDGKITGGDPELSSLAQDENGDYSITILDNGHTEQVLVKPVFSSEHFDEAMEAYQSMIRAFDLEVIERQERIDRMRVASVEVTQGDPVIIQSAEGQVPLDFYESTEQAMSVYRSFHMDNFGLWNCDSPTKLPQGALMDVSFALDGQQIELDQFFLVDDQVNALFAFYDGAQLSYNPNHNNAIWGVYNDVLVIVPSDRMKALDPQLDQVTLELTAVDQGLDAAAIRVALTGTTVTES